MRTKIGATELDSGEIKYYYRDGKNWNFLSEFNYANRTGFNPYAVDPRTNRALGFQRVDGRQAFVSMALDGTRTQKILGRELMKLTLTT
ncbi:MAG: hypothetical protein U5J78_08030 [Parasphingorhabdus sp.]|nr:hypothetical protein [Parasphingorhabdus sp.]